MHLLKQFQQKNQLRLTILLCNTFTDVYNGLNSFAPNNKGGQLTSVLPHSPAWLEWACIVDKTQ